MNSEVLIRNLIVGVLYCLSGYLTIALTTLPAPPLILIWLPSGVGLAAVLIYGPRVVPAIAAGSFLFAVVPHFDQDSSGAPILTIIMGGLWSAFVDSLKVLIEYWVCRKFIGDNIFSSVPKIIRFYSIGIVPTAAVSVFVLVSGDYFLGFLQIDHDGTLTSFLLGWFSIILSDLHGLIIIVPMIMAFWNKDFRKWAQQRVFEKVTILTCLAGIVFISLNYLDYFVYLVVPVFLWAALRIGLRGLTIALFLFSMSMSMGTVAGLGPFVSASQTTSLEAMFLISYTLNFTFVAFAAAWKEVQTQQDMLEQRIVERTKEFEDARDEAEKANSAKSQFLTAASHDLRQPVQAISLFSTALQTRLKDQEATLFTSKIQDAVYALSAMLDGLLDMSRLEGDAIAPQHSDFAIETLLDEIRRDYTLAANHKNLDLRVIPSSMIIRSDQALLARILGNLVSNAIRYTNEGRILIGCRRNRDSVRVEVWDTGRGISDVDLVRIFKPYQRIDNVGENITHGLGLGLAITKDFADILEIPLCVHSTPKKGSVFTLEMPKGSSSQAEYHAVKAVTHYSEMFDGRTILAIDDDDTIIDGMTIVLSDWGCKVVTAKSIKDALLIAIEQKRNLDVVICDLHLSESETGIELMKCIDEELDRSVPAIFISGDTRPEIHREIKRAGYFVLTKPIQPASLRVLLRRQFQSLDVVNS